MSELIQASGSARIASVWVEAVGEFAEGRRHDAGPKNLSYRSRLAREGVDHGVSGAKESLLL